MFEVLRIAMLAMSVPLAGVAQSTLTLQSDPFNELMRDSAQISGVVVAGALRHGGLSESRDEVSLTAELPPQWAGETVCTRALSADGLYQAENAYRLPPDWTGGLAVLPFPTAYSSTLLDFEERELAISIHGGSCDAVRSEIAVANWNLADVRGQPLLIVNSFRADDVFAYVDGHADAVRCLKIESRGLSAFDYSCLLPEATSNSIEITLYRLSNGKPAPPTVLTLWLGQSETE